MRRKKVSVLALGVTLALSAFAPDVRSAELTEAVRSLNTAQNKAVMGDAVAQAQIPRLRERFERALGAASAEDWSAPSAGNATATYLLCGGAPQGVHKALEAGVVPAGAAPLVTASLAYAEGREQDARDAFEKIDAASLPPTVGAHVALVRGGLLIGVDAGQARRHLAMARLLAPGSLVEEAALRREASMVNILEEPDAFLSISRRYKELYARSPFAGSFWRAIANAFATSALTLAPEQRAELEAIVVALPAPQRLDLHLAAARKAILNARLDLAQHFIGLGETLTQNGAEQRRVSLYRLALGAIGGASVDALEQMRKLDSSALSPQDIELRNIVGSAVTRLQGVARTSAPAPSGLALPQAEPESRPAETAMSSSIRQALSDTDMLLVKAAAP